MIHIYILVEKFCVSIVVEGKLFSIKSAL